MIEITNMSKYYRKNVGINNINLKLAKGKVYGLIGHNAVGKTTLIKTILGYLNPDSGSVKIENVSKKDDILNAISFMPDTLDFSGKLKLKDIIRFYNAITDDFDIEKMNKLLKKFKLDKHDIFPSLSRGKQMQFRLALCISRDTNIYIMDEPLGGIDIVARRNILEEILIEINTEDKCILISSHELYEIDGFLDEVIIMENGTVTGVYSVDEIKVKENKNLHQWYLDKFNG